MIFANNYRLNPTIFPDKTSQIWKLPEIVLDAHEIAVIWGFEQERELIDLMSLRRLCYSHPMSLYMPYLPYARQDKPVSNQSTFNLEVFADVLNSLRLSEVKVLDAHNTKRCKSLIKNFKNSFPREWHASLIQRIKPDLLVFPDEGASQRYKYLSGCEIPFVVLFKSRDHLTGKITYDDPNSFHRAIDPYRKSKKVMIVDDICDGGSTFVFTAKLIRHVIADCEIHLIVTHGIFSNGYAPLRDAGIECHSYREVMHE